jgi:hypothetical protein
MSIEPIHVAPVEHKVEPPAAPVRTPEQIRADDQLFAAQEREQQFVSGILGMYTGAMLLKDLAAEHLQRDEEETQPEAKEEPPG